MNAVLRPVPHAWAPMTVADLDQVLAIETRVYTVPWTRGNFVDSLAAGNAALLLLDARRELIGYFVAMEGVDEVHLLNIAVHPQHQGQGHARLMLDQAVAMCRNLHAQQLWLEVRMSNQGAKTLYLRYGFTQVGVRRGYYPLPLGEVGREDAVVMSLKLKDADDHGLE